MYKQIFLLIALLFLINLLWEFSHSLLYDWDQKPLQNDVEFYIKRIFLSTFGDLVILVFIFLIVSLKNQSLNWINNPTGVDYFILISFGLFAAILIEIRAMFQERWHYTDLMPTIFGIGLTPLVQLVLTSLLALWLVRR